MSGIVIRRVWFDLPRIEGESGGDCVRLLGAAGAEVTDVVMHRLTGLNCNRSFVAVQRGVHRVLLQDSTSLVVGGQSIDFEPTGGVGVLDSISDFRIVGNRLARGPAAKGAFTIAIGGRPDAVAERIVLASTLVFDGGVHVIDAHDVTLDGIVVAGRPGFLTLHIRKRAQRIRIKQSTFIRPAGAPDGEVVSIHHQSGYAPTDVTIDRSVLVQNTTRAVINVESLHSFTLTNSSLSYFGEPALFPAVIGRGVIAPIDQVAIRGNRFEGPMTHALQLSKFQQIAVGAVSVTGNLADALSQSGVRFEGGLPSVPPVICANDFGAVPPVLPEMPTSCP